MKKQIINNGWLFSRADGEKITINLPHDAMITEERDPNLENGSATAFYPGGKYIYEKIIPGDSELVNKKVIIEFEGVYMNSEVCLNDERVGGWIYGYTDFFVDITDKLAEGKDNVLKVTVDNSKTPNSRWYSGSGIYRNVNMWISDKCHIKPEGIKITTKSVYPAELEIDVETESAEGCQAEIMIYDADGTLVNRETAIITDQKASFNITVTDAKLWSADNPYLYSVKAELVKDGEVADEALVKTGIRTISWNAKQGLMINGETVKLYGGCIHHDNGILGARSFKKADFRRVSKLKEMGYNAIRFSHNPAGKDLLDVCDELGMYVLDESFDQWMYPQTAYDYAMYFKDEHRKDIRALISKDYNHPSVIMYCIGNEITDTGLSFGAAVAKQLNAYFHELDKTRPTTIAVNSMLSTLAHMQEQKKIAEEKAKAEGREAEEEKIAGSQEVNDIVALLPKIMAGITPQSLEDIVGECMNSVDIAGYNYSTALYDGIHDIAPDRVILSSETFPCRIAENYRAVNEHDYVIGDFSWTAWDYLGETGVGATTYGTDKAPFSQPYPYQTAACGSFDLNGNPEPHAFYSAILWGVYSKPYIAVRPVNHSGELFTNGKWRMTDAVHSWDWKGYEGKNAEVEVYAPGKEVELFLNNNSLGKKELTDAKAFFDVKYESGVLRAVAFDADGNNLGEDVLSTTGDEAFIKIMPEESQVKLNDIVFVPINIVDANGNIKLLDEHKVSIEINGPGTLLAFGSASPVTEESYFENTHTTYHGNVMAVVRAADVGNIVISAVSDKCLGQNECCTIAVSR